MRFGAAEVDAGAGDAPALARALAPRLEDDAGAWLDEVAEGSGGRLIERRLLRAMVRTFSQSNWRTLSGLREMSSKFFGR